MNKKVLYAVVVCAVVLGFAAGSARAQEPAKVAGKWEITSEGRQGPVTSTLTLEQDGEKIKGTLTNPRGEVPVEGAVKGNKITFSLKRQGPQGEITIEYSGTVDGDTIKGTVGAGQFSREFTGKRVK